VSTVRARAPGGISLSVCEAKYGRSKNIEIEDYQFWTAHKPNNRKSAVFKRIQSVTKPSVRPFFLLQIHRQNKTEEQSETTGGGIERSRIYFLDFLRKIGSVYLRNLRRRYTDDREWVFLENFLFTDFLQMISCSFFFPCNRSFFTIRLQVVLGVKRLSR